MSSYFKNWSSLRTLSNCNVIYLCQREHSFHNMTQPFKMKHHDLYLLRKHLKLWNNNTPKSIGKVITKQWLNCSMILRRTLSIKLLLLSIFVSV
ncbi:uncharacterized protein DS421_5g145250 [Arachis hypogaea]|nr:uncharacterized protein DS421_5g145250 [Arachis hypogaea]